MLHSKSSSARCSIPLVFILLSTVACGSVASQTDGGSNVVEDAGTAMPDGGADGGIAVDMDSGMTTGDAGLVDAGPLVALEVKPSTSNVLSAAATVSWSGDLRSVTVNLQAVDGGTPASTPTSDLVGLISPVTLPMLALQASTSYTAVATGFDMAGNPYTSAPVTFTTGALPSGVTQYAIADGGVSTPGYTMVARLPASGTMTSSDYVSIYDNATGAPVWYVQVSPHMAGDFQKQPDGTYTVAVSDPPSKIPGISSTTAKYEQFDSMGNLLHTWTAQNVPAGTPPAAMNAAGLHVAATDEHEIRLEPNGDAVLYGFVEQTQDLSALGGNPSANVVGDVLERVTADGTVTFAWNSLDYLDVKNTDPVATSNKGAVVDFPHANAIDVMADGSYLISLRSLSQIIKLDSTAGDIIWKLGGADGSFMFVNDPLNGFSCQHGARELPNGDIILFDDGDGHSPRQSRAVEYALDTTAMTATLVWSSEDTPPLYSYIMGFAQRLSNGHTLISYATSFHIQEVDASGNLLWDMSDPSKTYWFYRALHIDSLY